MGYILLLMSGPVADNQSTIAGCERKFMAPAVGNEKVILLPGGNLVMYLLFKVPSPLHPLINAQAERSPSILNEE